MLYYLISLVPDFEETPLRLFNYFTFRAAAALVTATLLGILLGPLTVRLLKKAVAPPRLEGIVAEEFVDHSKDKTPSMGGLLVVTSIILATLLWGDLTNRLLLLFLCTLAAFSAIGFIDDFTKIKSKKDGVSAKYKLVCQFAVSIMAILVYSHLTPEIAKTFCQLYVPFIKDPVWIMPYPVAVAFAVFVLVGTSNAVNLTDGKDGLATGCTIWCMMTYALIAYLCTNSIFASHLDLPFIRNGAEIVVFAAAIIGAEQFCTITMKRETDLRIHQYDTFKGCQDIIQLCSIRLQELPSGRNIEEEILYQEVTAHRTSHGLLS